MPKTVWDIDGIVKKDWDGTLMKYSFQNKYRTGCSNNTGLRERKEFLHGEIKKRAELLYSIPMDEENIGDVKKRLYKRNKRIDKYTHISQSNRRNEFPLIAAAEVLLSVIINSLLSLNMKQAFEETSEMSLKSGEGKINFDGTPLEKNIQRIEGTYGFSVTAVDSTLFNEKVSGSLQNSNLKVLMAGIEQALNLNIKRKLETSFLISA